MADKEDLLLKSADFDEVYQYAKVLEERGYEVKLTANNGQVVRIVNGNCMGRRDGKDEPYTLTVDDIYNHVPWGIRYRRKRGDPWLGLVAVRRLLAKMAAAQEQEQANSEDTQDAQDDGGNG